MSTSSLNRPIGSVSIPVEIVSSGTGSKRRLQPRSIHLDNYDRLIHGSPLSQPFRKFNTHYERTTPRPYQQGIREPDSWNVSRSNEDLLSPSMDTMPSDFDSAFDSFRRSGFNRAFPFDSDFFQPNKYSHLHHRSYDGLNDSVHSRRNQQPDPSEQKPVYRSTFETHVRPKSNHLYADIDETMATSSPSVTPQTAGSSPNDRSHSPARTASFTAPARDEPDLKLAKDTTGPIPMPASASASKSPTNDQQVPLAETVTPQAASPPPPPPAPVRDPNEIALEKLELIQQSLAGLNEQVDAFTGSTRDDRQYKLLDEQAVKIMMRCDELIDVSADVKEKRKEVIRHVQTVLAKLESKVPTTPSIEHNSTQMDTAMIAYDSSLNDTEHPPSTQLTQEPASIEQPVSTRMSQS